ncbi:MAG: hypothetical protein JW847_04740 [Candidatus Omnitrophica bacterium]|nr:hypothetical protein [Candidatus Omnitrophota bacterium]
MKKLLSVSLLLSLIGCASINIPNYIRDKNPYKKSFYTHFVRAREAVMKTFEETGWTVESESEPALFERERDLKSGLKQTLIFSDVRQTSFFIGTRYSKLNVYVHEIADNETEIEIRYLILTNVVFKNFYSYKNDRAVDRIFKKIEEDLSS